jgi:hypothetical protein
MLVVATVGGVTCGGLFLPLMNDAMADNNIKIRITMPPQIPNVFKSIFFVFSSGTAVGSISFSGEAEGDNILPIYYLDWVCA